LPFSGLGPSNQLQPVSGVRMYSLTVVSPHRGDGVGCGSSDDVYAALRRRDVDKSLYILMHPHAPYLMSCPCLPSRYDRILRPRQQHGTSGAHLGLAFFWVVNVNSGLKSLEKPLCLGFYISVNATRPWPHVLRTWHIDDASLAGSNKVCVSTAS